MKNLNINVCMWRNEALQKNMGHGDQQDTCIAAPTHQVKVLYGRSTFFDSAPTDRWHW